MNYQLPPPEILYKLLEARSEELLSQIDDLDDDIDANKEPDININKHYNINT
jgi:hypothetical protein